MTKRAIIGIALITVAVGIACRISSVRDLTGGTTSTAEWRSESPFRLAPNRLTLPMGAVARFDVLRTETLLNASFEWSIEGLPSGASAEFSTGIGYPVDGVLLIRTSGTSPPGIYPLGVTLSSDEHTWSEEITLELTPCQEMVQTGTFVTQTGVAQLAGGPSTLVYGNGSYVMVFCASTTARRLTVRVQSATNQQGEPWTGTDAALTLFRLLDWPPPDAITEIVTENRDDRNVESVATGDDGILSWDITPGVFFIYFPQHQFRETPSEIARFSPAISVTYHIDVESTP